MIILFIFQKIELIIKFKKWFLNKTKARVNLKLKLHFKNKNETEYENLEKIDLIHKLG